MAPQSTYDRIIEHIFLSHYREGAEEVAFEREEIADAARRLNLDRPKNLGDVVYSFRHRRPLPPAVQSRAPEGKAWVIRLHGASRYRFVAVPTAAIVPSARMAVTKVPDATPGIIALYALSDEQALLARLRYNRLIDVFTGVACYSLQSHLRTQVSDIGQVETDEIYVGLDRQGVHYAFPVQAKGGSEMLSVVQIEQDLALCAEKFPSLVCRPIGAQFVGEWGMALFEFEIQDGDVVVSAERHYELVPAEELTEEDLASYRARLAGKP